MGEEVFNLEKVLNFRREVEKVCCLDLAAATLDFEGASERLKVEEKSLDRLTRELARKQEEGIVAGELQLYNDCCLRKNGDIRNHRQTIVTLGREMEEKRESLLIAARDKKTMELYKEWKNMAQQKKMAEREQAFINEIAIRKKRGGKK